VRPDIVKVVERLAALPGIETVAMTTNGITLANQVAALRQAGLRQLNVSLDTLKDFKFQIITRRKGT
jgi:molybdenum cofactor biosynthesis enzyme MoaA